MSSGPELFVVCKKCNSEVSPYVTECPYCGTRLRKRAPKLEKGGVPKASRRRERPKLSRLRPGEIPGVRADRRPYATIFLVLASVLVTLFFQVRALNVINYLDDVVATSPLNGDYWKLVTQLFVYWPSTALRGRDAQRGLPVRLAAGAAARRVGAAARLLRRRTGRLGWPSLALDPNGGTIGAKSSALALLAAWSMRDILARRRGEEDDADLLGVLAIAIVLVLLPAVSPLPNSLAGLTGGVVGILLGLLLARLPQR